MLSSTWWTGAARRSGQSPCTSRGLRATRSRLSACRSSRAMPPARFSGIRARTELRPVARVDADVPFGEVASPEARRALALAADVEANFAVRRIQLALQVRFRERRRETAPTHRRALQMH